MFLRKGHCLKVQLPLEHLGCLGDKQMGTIGRVHDQMVIDHLNGILYRYAQSRTAENRCVPDDLCNVFRFYQRPCAVVDSDHRCAFGKRMETAHHAFLPGRTAGNDGVEFCDAALLRRFPDGIVIGRTCHHDDFRHTRASLEGTHTHADHIGISQRQQDLILSLHPGGVSGAHQDHRGVLYL